MEKTAQKVSQFDQDVAAFLTALGDALQHYRGPGLSDSIDQIAAGMGSCGKLLVLELARSLQKFSA